MIIGTHSIVYSRNAEADRAFLRDVLGLSGVDGGSNGLVFSLVPAEVAVHAADTNGTHELCLMCDDIQDFTDSMQRQHVECSPIEQTGWGLLTRVSLPGGGRIGVYEPSQERRHSSKHKL